MNCPYQFIDGRGGEKGYNYKNYVCGRIFLFLLVLFLVVRHHTLDITGLKRVGYDIKYYLNTADYKCGFKNSIRHWWDTNGAKERIVHNC